MLVDLDDVRGAIDLGQLVPCFQPLVEIRSGCLIGFEVLARWCHPTQGLILPENFFPLAEKHGLIDAIMEQICPQAFRAALTFDRPLTLSINLSPIQFADTKLPRRIALMAENAGLPMSSITIEITETALLSDLHCAHAIAMEFKQLGCHLSLDDFGTGFSSLGHLQALPFDQLKIDRSFIHSMASTRENRKIVAAVIGLGHTLGLQTVAEGIETEQQADMLHWLGCEVGQGWLYGRPMPASELPAALAAAPHNTVLTSPGDGWAVSSLEALPTQRLAQLQAIYDGSPVGLCFLDRNLRYVSLNSRLAEMHGVSVAAHLGRTVEEVLPALYQEVCPYLTRALHGEAIAKVEVVKPPSFPNDPERSLLLSYQPAWDEADEVIGISVAVVDMTEAQPPKAVVEVTPSSPTPWAMDAVGHNLNASSQWVRELDSSYTETRNLGWLEALHPEDLASAMQTMRHCLRTGDPIDMSYRVRDCDGVWRWMRSTGRPRFTPDGAISRWYGSVEEIDGTHQSTIEIERHAQTISDEALFEAAAIVSH